MTFDLNVLADSNLDWMETWRQNRPKFQQTHFQVSYVTLVNKALGVTVERKGESR